MKPFVCCLLLLPFVTMVLAAPVRAQGENVLSFLNDALGAATTPADVAAYRNPSSKPVTEKDSEDISDAKSTENFDTNGFPAPEVSYENGGESRDGATDLESHEIVVPKVVDDNAPSGRKTGLDKASMRLADTRGPVQESREPTDVDSEEGMTVDAQEDGKQDIRLSGDRVTDSGSQGANLRREAGRVNGPSGMLAPGQSREMLDRDSLEDNNGQLAVVGSSRDTDFDETREYISSETYPRAPEHAPSRLSVPAKSRAPW